MSAKVFIVFCVKAFLAQAVFGQCLSAGLLSCGALGSNGLGHGAGLNYGAGYGIGSSCSGSGLNIGAGLGYAGNGQNAGIEAIPTTSGPLSVSSGSAVPPSGISLASENTYEGALMVTGELPFLSAVALEGVLPTSGLGTVQYSCGNGLTAITSELGSSPSAIGLGAAGIGSGALGYGSSIGSYPTGAGYGLLGANGCGCGRY